MNSTALLHKITLCQNVARCFANPNLHHDCRAIVDYQRVEVANLEDFQIPEPWNGHIQDAPILFVGPNPSLSWKEDYPRWKMPKRDVEIFFMNRFDVPRVVRYWSEAQNRASELLGRDAKAGVDYAITEVVHCKSKHQKGVEDALVECYERYFQMIMEISPAIIIIVYGQLAQEILMRRIDGLKSKYLQGPIEVAGRSRFFIFSPHPGSNKPRVFPKLFTPRQMQMLQSVLLDTQDS